MPETRLVAKLKATTAVTDLVAARIWPGFRPEGSALPAIVYEMTTDSPVNYAGGTTGTAEMNLVVSSIATTYAGAKALGAAVATAMSGFVDTSSCVWHLDNQSDDFGAVKSGQDVLEYYAVVQNYSVWH